MAMHRDKLARVMAIAMQSGATRTGPITLEWDISGVCLDPVTVEHWATRDLGNERERVQHPKDPAGSAPLRLIQHLHCRKCEMCLKARQIKWQTRAIALHGLAIRSWLVTLTFHPNERFKVLAQARRASRADYDALEPLEQFRKLDGAAYGRVQRFLKRIRKNSKAEIRYLCVTEPHKDGFPHYHLLLAQKGDMPLLYRHIDSAWSYGHSHEKLLPPEDVRGASYACKYLAKDLRSQVRASIHSKNVKTPPKNGGSCEARGVDEPPTGPAPSA